MPIHGSLYYDYFPDVNEYDYGTDWSDEELNVKSKIVLEKEKKQLEKKIRKFKNRLQKNTDILNFVELTNKRIRSIKRENDRIINFIAKMNNRIAEINIQLATETLESMNMNEN